MRGTAHPHVDARTDLCLVDESWIGGRDSRSRSAGAEPKAVVTGGHYPLSVTSTDDRQFPVALAAALAVPFDYNDGEGVDFEPFPAFLTAEDTTDWFRAWTGNQELTGDAFRVFGQDGTGGYTAFWLIRPDRPLTDQPVVFLGSEGETGVVARSLGDFLWLLAGGFGPWEASADHEPDWAPQPNSAFAAIARRFAPDREQSAAAVIEQAAREFPDFDETIMELCR